MSTNIPIRCMQPDYRPDEKFLRYGADALTGAELLAIILRTGCQGQSSVELTAGLLKSPQTGCEDLLKIYSCDFEELVRMKGIGTVKALQIKSVAELSKRISLCRTADHLDFSNPRTIAEHYMEQLRHRKRECVMILLLNSACRLIKDIYLTEGTVNASLFSPREIFIEALKYEAVNVILLHNHPGGSPSPSQADIDGTKLIAGAGLLLGVKLLDHIIIGDMEFFSFKEQGLLNE